MLRKLLITLALVGLSQSTLAQLTDINTARRQSASANIQSIDFDSLISSSEQKITQEIKNKQQPTIIAPNFSNLCQSSDKFVSISGY